MEVLIVVLILIVALVSYFLKFIFGLFNASEEWKEQVIQDNSKILDNSKKIADLEVHQFDEPFTLEEYDLFTEYFKILKKRHPLMEYEDRFYAYGSTDEEYYVTVYNVPKQVTKELEEWEYQNISEKL